jgi:dolichol-phosphate mannosyltransferase
VGRLVVVDDGVPVSVRPELSRVVLEAGGSVRRAGGPGGKGSAIASSIEWLQATGEPEAVLVMDADGQHPPEVIPQFLAAALRAELVIGNRFADPRRMPLVRRLSNRAASRLLAARTGVVVYDSQCGMRLLRGRALREVPPARGGYEAESEHLKRCLLAGVSVEWVPIPAIYDGQASSFRVLRDGVRVAWTLLR